MQKQALSTKSDNWTVYIIETNAGKLYTGITNNLARRTQQHCNGQGAKYFRTDPPRRLIWHETNHTRSTASRREVEIKQLTRAKKLKIIADAGHTPLPVPLPD